MAPRFHRLTVDEFARVLREYRVTREINAVHMHHTWSPDHAEFRGHQSIVGMWRFHTHHNGWSTIAQHITIDPQGYIWTGRDWNSPPASAAGNNGTSRSGPFMFEMVGNFDAGHDEWVDPQKTATLRVIALVQERFGLPVTSLRFHNQLTTAKTCPGTAIRYEDVIRAVETMRQQPITEAEVPRGAPLPGFRSVVDDVLEDMATATVEASRGGRVLGPDPADAEPAEAGDAIGMARAAVDEPEAARGSGLSASQIASLRPYIINLRQGEFSDDGEFTSTEGDIEAIVENLRIEIENRSNLNDPLRIVFWAHGGLVSEGAALQRAYDHVHRLWRPNGVYPIYFIWETGLFETLGQMLEGMRQRTRGARDIWDHTTDRLVEKLCRQLGADRIWASMKTSAERASAEDTGGARYAATRIAQLIGGLPPNSVELHAVGHSAGSIFHSHFVPAAVAEGLPVFQSLQLLAPAITIPDFLNTLQPIIGMDDANTAVRGTVMYTMKKDLEKDDSCKGVYRKSLLYLIHHALEPAARTPILGLEEDVRIDRIAADLFGLRGDISARGEVVWSESILEAGRSASRSRTHGGFDEDPSTLNSVLRRVLGVGDTDRIKEYTRAEGARSVDPWASTIEWPDELTVPQQDGGWTPVSSIAPVSAEFGRAAAATGRRTAVCVGIDEYANAPLAGCVADAKLWAKTLAALGFASPKILLNEQATRSAIIRELDTLVRESRPGDVVVFQFAGHGTQLPDLSGDEDTGDSPGQDEALCPYDMDRGAYVLDDDVGAIFDHLPDGVNLTCFIDCCHSGTISRFGVGKTSDAPRQNERARFIQATPGMIAAHTNFRAALPATRNAARGPERMREILFSACRSTELAYETNGQGQFTLHATRALSEGGALTNEGFRNRVTALFGAAPRQHPELHCAPDRRSQPLLATGGSGPTVSASFATANVTDRPAPNAALLDLLRLICNAAQTQ